MSESFDDIGERTMEKTLKKILTLADVQINGKRHWDIKIHNPEFYRRVLAGGSLALGEAYMDGWWDCDAVDQFIFKIVRAELDQQVKGWKKIDVIWPILRAKILNVQTKSRVRKVTAKHYDLSNELFENMLDKSMTYSCGYWENAQNLDQAQEAKLDLICKKLNLKHGEKILDIGCGWGSFARHAAENYNAHVVGITISKEQVELARERSKRLSVDIRLQDYRDLNEQFDHIVSIGMVEHVGYKNHRSYMKVVHRCLKDDGLFLLHTIGYNTSQVTNDPWMNKYIFPNATGPSPIQLSKAIEELFIIEDWQCFGTHYDRTLMAWHENFIKNWDKIKQNYDHKFFRMWKYYLLMCAGAARSALFPVWHIVLSKRGVVGGYKSIR